MPIIHLFAASVNFTICAVRAMIVTVMKMTEKKIKLIALDLDDTTLRSDASLAPETAQAIANAVKSGTQVVIASGRAFKSLPQSVLDIDGIRYAICSNGACIEDMHSRTRLLSFTLRPQVVEQLLETFSGERFEAFIDGQPYCDGEYYEGPLRFGCSPAYVDYVKTTRIPVDDMPDFMRRHIAELDNVDVMCGTLEHKQKLWEKAQKLSDVYVTSSSPRLIEISAAEAGKGAALQRLAQILNIPPQHIAAFGNGDNDADMLAFAGLGIAVKNASKRCLAAADYICPTNDEHGVAITIEKLLTSN